MVDFNDLTWKFLEGYIMLIILYYKYKKEQFLPIYHSGQLSEILLGQMLYILIIEK